MLFLFFIALACAVRHCYARTADTKPYLSETCREISSMGLNTCAYCNWTGIALCNQDAYWDGCQDKATPNPCTSNEILALESRDYLTNYDDTCKKVCPGQYCYSNTNKYKSKCCGCPSGYRPSITPPTCWGHRGPGVGVTCVGCNNANEALVGNDQKGWECLPTTTSSSAKPKTSTSTSSAKPSASSTCNRTCGKDTWCRAHWVTRNNTDGTQSKLCQCDGGDCKDKSALCPSACLISKPVVPTDCPAVTCPKVNDKDKCFPNQKGLDLIRGAEALCTTPYNVCDAETVNGVKTTGVIKTIGWGHNCNSHGDCANLTLPLSLCEADRLFRCDVAELMQYVKKLPNYTRLSLNQFSALVSLAFQYPAAFNKGRSIWNHMDVAAKDFNYTVVCNDILGATTEYQDRRKKEKALCLEAPVTAMSC